MVVSVPSVCSHASYINLNVLQHLRFCNQTRALDFDGQVGTSFYIHVFMKCIGTQAGCNQWVWLALILHSYIIILNFQVGELEPDRQGRAYVFLNKVCKALTR